MELKYQTTITDKIASLDFDNCPNSNIIIGPYGSGKHTICQLISNQLNIPIIDVSDITLDTINNLYCNPLPTMYIVEGDGLSERNNNAILKLLEEPPQTAFIFILTTYENGLLPTILSRCYHWNIKPYTQDSLYDFIIDKTKSNLILSICSTPGEIIDLQSTNNIDELIKYANLIIDKIAIASFSNTLNISDKITFEKEEGKFDGYVMCKLIRKLLLDRIAKQDTDIYVTAYGVVSRLHQKLIKQNMNKMHLFEHFLFDLKLSVME